MDINKLHEIYFHPFVKSAQMNTNNFNKKLIMSLIVLSYFTIFIPLTVEATYHANSLIGRVTIKKKEVISPEMAEEELRIGIIYLGGKDLPQDTTQAIKHMEKAVQLGSSNAMVALGQLYLEGEYVKPDLTQAKDYFERAAQQNHPLAQENITKLNRLKSN